MNIIRNMKMKKRNIIAFSLIIAMILTIASSIIFPLASAGVGPVVGTNINVTNESHGQDEPNIAINPLHNTFQPMDIHVAVGVNDYRGGTGRSIPGLYTSTDLTSWTYHSVNKPSADAYGNAVLDYDSAGNLYYAYMAFNIGTTAPGGSNAYNGAIYISKSIDEGVSWAFVKLVSGSGTSQDPYYDRPWLTIDKSNNYIYVTWTVWHGLGSTCTGSDIMFARSINGGVTFSSPITLSSGGANVQRQWSDIGIGPSGEVYVTWRRFGTGGVTRALFLAKSTTHGASFNPESLVIQYPTFDGGDYTNDYAAPATPTWPHLAVGPEGNLYIAWHKYIADWNRDLNFIRSTDGGGTWGSVMTLASSSNDQFWPTLAVSPTGRLDVVWYDRRDDSNNRLLNLYYTGSADGGATFDPITKVTTATSDVSVGSPTSSLYFGDYIHMTETADGVALPVWTDTRVGNQEIFIASVSQAPAQTYDVTINAHCNTEATDVSVAITMDGNPTGFNTPHTFSALEGIYTFTVPATDASNHPFKQWNTGETSTTITVNSAGTYTAYYEAPAQVTIWSSDSVGNPKDVFVLGETVYVTVPRIGQIVTLYVVADKTTWSTGDLLTDVSTDGAETATLDAPPGTQTIQIWAPPLVPGHYDIVMDVDNDGVFDTGLDLVDSVQIVGFNVVPEVPFGVAMAFLSMIIALVGFAGFKRFRPKIRLQ